MQNEQTCHNYIYTANKEDEEYKLVDFLREKHLYSHRLINSIKKDGTICINGSRERFNYVLKENDEINIDFGIETYDAKSVKIDFDVIYEDEDILLINKPANLITHPTRYHQEDTLANGIYYMFEKKNLICKARFVNRLDMDTSGIVLVAKNKYSHHFIQQQMLAGKVKKVYIAVVKGIIKESKGIINAPVGKAEDDKIAREVNQAGKESITEFEVIKRLRDLTLIKIILHTGRTHQIRVHMQYLNHPLLGDSLYDKKSDIINRQALHALSIGFVHPRTKQYQKYTAPIAGDIKKIFNI
jgi:23S rRNA pseudouridine1911/1915/1917 synthase